MPLEAAPPSLQDQFRPGDMPLGLCHPCVIEWKQAEADGFGGGVPVVSAAIVMIAKFEVQQVPGMGQAAGLIPLGTCARHLVTHKPGAGVLAAGSLPDGFRRPS
jgi:hypothetical protein